MDGTTLYRKTEKGRREVDERPLGLEGHARRLLIMIDGQRDSAELSVYVRAGEFESTLERLLAEGFVEEVGAEDASPDRIARAPAANDPAVFAEIKARAAAEIGSRLHGRVAKLLVEEIEACPTALALREKLRTLEESLVRLLGQEEGVALARDIGAELTRLTPWSPLTSGSAWRPS